MKGDKMNKQEHIDIHINLHNNLDVLLADFIQETGRLPSKTTLTDFLEWSFDQTTNPSDNFEEAK